MAAEVPPNLHYDPNSGTPHNLWHLIETLEKSKTRPKPTYLPSDFPPDNPPMAYRRMFIVLGSCDDPIDIRLVSNIYEINPERLAENGVKERIFFSLRGRKYENDTKIKASGGGFWHLNSYEGAASDASLRIFKFCKENQFEVDNPKRFEEPEWYMEENRLSSDFYPSAEIGDWVLCYLYEALSNHPLNVTMCPYLSKYYKEPPTHSTMLTRTINIPPNDYTIPIVINLQNHLSSHLGGGSSGGPLNNIPQVHLNINLQGPGSSQQFSRDPLYPLIDLTGPPNVYVILLYSIINRGDQILKGSFEVIPNMILSNIYEIDPDELADHHGDNQDKEWFCFSIRRRFVNDTVLSRAIGDGYWLHQTGADSVITFAPISPIIGLRRTFQFYKGKHPSSDKTTWMMHEFRLDEPNLRKPEVGDWVLYKIWNNEKTSGSGLPSDHLHTKTRICTPSGESHQRNEEKEV